MGLTDRMVARLRGEHICRIYLVWDEMGRRGIDTFPRV